MVDNRRSRVLGITSYTMTSCIDEYCAYFNYTRSICDSFPVIEGRVMLLRWGVMA